MEVYNKQKCIVYFLKKYPYMKAEDISLLYDISVDTFVNLKYPFEYNITDEKIELETKKHPTWCLRCIQEQIDKTGISNVIGYSENGVSIKFDKTGLSQALIDEIVSEAFIG